MKYLVSLGAAALFLAAVFYNAEQNRVSGQEDSAVAAVEKVLNAESRTLQARLEETSLQADRDALLAAARWRKHPGMRAFLSDTALSEPNSPKWVIVAGRRVRAAGVIDDALLEDALEAHLKGSDRFALYSAHGKYYLFVKGNLATGQPYSLAYDPQTFFAAFMAGDGLRVWIMNREGTVIFHPLPRFIGSNVANLRPVAKSLQKLTEKSGSENPEPFTQRYLGLEGKNALGAWTPLPKLGLIVANEWPRAPGTESRYSAWFWLALACSWIAIASLAAAFARRKPSTTVSVPQPIFDQSRLDDDALDYLENAKASADQAILFAQSQEEMAQQALSERARATGRMRQLDTKIRLLEAFQDRILPILTGKQVWSELGRLICDAAPGLTVTVFRYSPSSFSLVPEICFDGAQLPENAAAYLRDARIFIGNPKLLNSVLQTQAFTKWNAARERHMPLQRSEFRIYPFAAQGVKGAILVLFDERTNSQGELDDMLSLTEQLVRRAGTFCDSLTPLIQSSYAKANAGPHLAGAPDGARNRPRPS